MADVDFVAIRMRKGAAGMPNLGSPGDDQRRNARSILQRYHAVNSSGEDPGIRCTSGDGSRKERFGDSATHGQLELTLLYNHQ